MRHRKEPGPARHRLEGGPSRRRVTAVALAFTAAAAGAAISAVPATAGTKHLKRHSGRPSPTSSPTPSPTATVSADGTTATGSATVSPSPSPSATVSPSPTATQSATGTSTTRSGAFAGGPSGVTTFGDWRGTAAGIAHGFIGSGTWADIEVTSSWASWWGNSVHGGHMLLTIPMLPKDTSTTIQTGATGAYDAHFKTAAQHLVAAGMGNAIIRIGHEFNQKWPRWSAINDPASYAAYFRHIVTAMRSVAGQSFRFTWCPGSSYTGFDPTTAYPGDAYVDIVSIDSYDMWWNHPDATPDQRWTFIVDGAQQGGLSFWAGFAGAHHKPLGFGEWGLVNADAVMANGGGGGDDPYYIRQMHDWIQNHDVAFEAYLESDPADGLHKMEGGNFPNAAAEYVRLW
jgi:hypothetical protein